MSIIIGVDIGGSHISSAAINNEDYSLINGTYFCGPVNSKASKEVILGKWAETINRTLIAIQEILVVDSIQEVGIAFSMPGPFQYQTGIAMFEGNDKYESLYNVNISEELTQYLNTSNVCFRFLNDASCFGVGGVLKQNLNSEFRNKTVAITLGTGFGAAFLDDMVPVTQGEGIPENGCLWDKKYKEGIADNYFSTRWFIKEYESLSNHKITGGVKEIAELENDITFKVFNNFVSNLTEFLAPFLKEFNANVLIIGGNIAKSNRLFLSQLDANFKQLGINLSIRIVENTEETSIVGSGYLFNEIFWEKIKEELPFF